MTRSTIFLLLPAALLLAADLSLAQPGPRGPGPAASGASAPRMGMGRGMMGRGRFGPDNTPGWALMSPAERSAHRERMSGLKTEKDCRAYMDEHHRQMQERAKQKGGSVPARPRRDPCAGLGG